MAFVNEENIEDRTWKTIDRERNIVLKKVGGGMPESPHDFNLNIDGEEINFSAFIKRNQKKKEELAPGEKAFRVEWLVVQIFGPSQLRTDKSKLYPLIEEALDAYGTASSRKHVESLTVTFAPNL
jgi:hypothetical protein